MSLFTDLARLDATNPAHIKLVEDLARAKARHDILRQIKHRKDPSLFAALLEYRRLRNLVRFEGQTALEKLAPVDEVSDDL